MRYSQILEAKEQFVLADYTHLGLTPEQAAGYLQFNIPPKAAVTCVKYDVTPAEAKRDMEASEKQRKQERAQEKTISMLPKLAAASTPITHEQACMLIAYDDGTFWDLMNWLNGEPDLYEDHPDKAAKMLAVIKRIKPFAHPPLYRGESTTRVREDQRGFHSWTPSEQAVKLHSRESGSRVLMLTQPIKGVDHSQIGYWRMRLYPGESHYLGSRAEWFVLDGYPAKVVQ